MFKRALVYFSFILLIGLVYAQSQQLFLTFYVLFPVVLFFLFYFYDQQDYFFFTFAGLCMAAMYVYRLYEERSVEMLSFGIGCAVFFGFLVTYRTHWSRQLQAETSQTDHVSKELLTLREKYHARLDSLHHLEKQVSSLLELFEIARDFSEALSSGALADLLYKKVLPILPFQKMRFILVQKSDGKVQYSRLFTIDENGAREESPEFSRDEIQVFDQLQISRQLIKLPLNPERWIFPIILEGSLAAVLSVDGASSEDLVKFEVLVAHLVLQVKKINLYETVHELSIIDGLTGVYVRRHFLERFEDELRRTIKYQLPLAVLMLDIDHFKRYNDEFGHLVGDATLKEVASLLKHSLRKMDIVARYGGEEFIAVLPETHPQGALEVAERIRSNIARHAFKVYDVEARVTVSIGISFFPADITSEVTEGHYAELGFDLIRHADKALYRAKEEGRNRVFQFRDL